MELTVMFEILDPAVLEATPSPEHQLQESVSSLCPPHLSWAWASVAEGSLSKNGYEHSDWESRGQSTNPYKGKPLRIPEGMIRGPCSKTSQFTPSKEAQGDS